MTVKEAVLEYITNHKGTTFVELERLFDRLGFDWVGQYSLFHDKYRNILFWTGWSGAAFKIITELQNEGLIKKTPSDIVLYVADSKPLYLPLAKGLRNYKTERWYPVVFDAVTKKGGL